MQENAERETRVALREAKRNEVDELVKLVAGAEIDEQVREGILERITDASEPTPWISNLVVVPKGTKPIVAKTSVDPMRNCSASGPRTTLEPAADPIRVRLT